MNINIDISEAVALLCFMGDAIFALDTGNKDDEELNGKKMLFNGICEQVNKELPEDEQYSLYDVE